MDKKIFQGDILKCYGCRACEQICPKRCITMQENVEGFIYPIVDNTICINCDMCESVCPVNTSFNGNSKTEQITYAAWNRKFSERISSSSGGVFPAIASEVIDAGGIVYGCAWGENNLIASQIRISRKEDIIRLKGSKYVQSSTENTYKEVFHDLRNGLTVLYSGTSCQIAGLKLFLKIEYEKLITIDLICHGTPSHKMLDAYVRYIEKKENGKISNLKFRDKKLSGWRSWVTYINEKSNKKHFCLGGSTPYMFGFYRGYFSRESCYKCQFTNSQRVGDITLADYWGIDKFQPELYREQKYGISLIICNTRKGFKYIDTVKKLIVLNDSKIEYAIAGNHSLSKQNRRGRYRGEAYLDLENKGFEYMANHYLKPKFMLIRGLVPSEFKNLYKYFKWKLRK